MNDIFDFVVIGAGGGGEAAAHSARARGASVAIVDRDLFGGSCPFWACMSSKTLLHAAEVRAHGGDYAWPKASDRRDYMIVRDGRDYPDDSGHVRSLEGAGATVLHESVLALKLGTSIDVLAETVHAFPTVARVMGGLFAKVALDLR